MKNKIHRFLTRHGLRHIAAKPWRHEFKGVRLRGPLHSLAGWLLGITN